MANKITFSFYNITVCVESDEDAVLDFIKHDFSYFASSIDSCDLKITYHCQKPDYDKLPEMVSFLATPRNICYKHQKITYVDYFGRALNIYDKNASRCDIYTENKELAHEIIYLTMLSRVSEKLDRNRIHRIHGLGLEYKNRGVIIMLPCGGGKTTLAMSILNSKNSEIRLLSEDSPLVTASGALLPFPLRIGLIPENVPFGMPEKYLLHIKRMECGPKVTVDIEYFKDRICKNKTKPYAMLLGIRSTGKTAKIVPAPKLAVIKYCLMNSVIGIGLYQGLEFIMQGNIIKLIGNIGTIFSKICNNFNLIAKSKVFYFVLSRNISQNYAVLEEFLNNF